MRARQSGIALVTALLIVAVAVIAAAAMLTTHNVAVHRSSNLRYIEQAWWFGAGVENWIGEILRDDRKKSEIDHLGEDWAQPVEQLPIEGGFVRGRVIDQQGCFNLNNLGGQAAERAAAQLRRLLNLVEGSDSYAAPNLVQAIQDWMDPNQDPLIPGGAEDGVYTALTPPYRTADRPLLSVTELLMVSGMSAELYRALTVAPDVCVLPESNTKINVNTAGPAVLASLADGLTLQDGEQLAAKREAKPFETTDEFRADPLLAGRAVDPDAISVDTNYFLLAGEVHVGNGRVNLYSLIFRAPDGEPHLLAHSKDAY